MNLLELEFQPEEALLAIQRIVYQEHNTMEELTNAMLEINGVLNQYIDQFV